MKKWIWSLLAFVAIFSFMVPATMAGEMTLDGVANPVSFFKNDGQNFDVRVIPFITPISANFAVAGVVVEIECQSGYVETEHLNSGSGSYAMVITSGLIFNFSRNLENTSCMVTWSDQRPNYRVKNFTDVTVMVKKAYDADVGHLTGALISKDIVAISRAAEVASHAIWTISDAGHLRV